VSTGQSGQSHIVSSITWPLLYKPTYSETADIHSFTSHPSTCFGHRRRSLRSF